MRRMEKSLMAFAAAASLLLTSAVLPVMAEEATKEPDAEIAVEAVQEEDDFWAYAGITLDSEALGIGSVYYTEAYYEAAKEGGYLNPLTVAPYTEEELKTICEGEGEGYIPAPEDAFIGISAFGSDTVFWYDAERAAAIFSHADPLVLDGETGSLTGAVASPITEAEAKDRKVYFALPLKSELLGIETVCYLDSYFGEKDERISPVTLAPYTKDEIADLAKAATEAKAPEAALIGILPFGGEEAFWYDAENANAIVSHADALMLDKETGVLTGEIASPALKNWAYGAITVGSEDLNIGTVYYSEAYFGLEGILNPITLKAYTEEELETIKKGAVVGAEKYLAGLPEEAVLAIATYDEKTIFFYDAESCATIVSHSDPLVLDGETGSLTGAVASPITEAEAKDRKVYFALPLKSEPLGIDTVCYLDSYFGEKDERISPVTLAPYAKDEIADLAKAATEAKAPEAAVIGILPFGGEEAFWYDAENANAIVSHADALMLDKETGVLTGQIASPALKNWAYGAITVGSEDLNIGTVYYSEAYFGLEGIVNPLTTEAYTAEEIEAIKKGAVLGDEKYLSDLAEGAVLAITAFDEKTIFFYDAEGCAAIVSHADPLVLDGETGILMTTEGKEAAKAMMPEDAAEKEASAGEEETSATEAETKAP